MRIKATFRTDAEIVAEYFFEVEGSHKLARRAILPSGRRQPLMNLRGTKLHFAL